MRDKQPRDALRAQGSGIVLENPRLHEFLKYGISLARLTFLAVYGGWLEGLGSACGVKIRSLRCGIPSVPLICSPLYGVWLEGSDQLVGSKAKS